ncbi:MAG: class I SAM-dependent methyltransferase [Chitinophagales bacterium]
MILKEFFEYYLAKVDPKVKEQLLQLIPADIPRTPENLASMFERFDSEAIEFLLNFHALMGEIRQKDPYNAIIFNNVDNICFPFFIEYIWPRLPGDVRSSIEEHFGTSDVIKIITELEGERDSRNWFRIKISPALTQDDLFSMNNVIALQNFSSGGEYSFLNMVLPRIKNLEGKILDAGCGAGFASLVMSQYLDVFGLDACAERLNRGRVLAGFMKTGETNLFGRVLNLIAAEHGAMTGEYGFPGAEELVTGSSRDIEFTQGSLDSLPYPDATFNAVLCMDVLEHTYSPEAVIKQFARVTKPGAIVFITAPNTCGEIHQRYVESEEGVTFPALLHMNHFEQDQLTQLFRTQGFEEISVKPFDSIPVQDFARMIKEDDVQGQALLAKAKDEIALQLFAIYRRM